MGTQREVPKLLSVREAAKATGVQRWRFYEMLKRREGPPYLKLGRTIRIPEHTLIEWIEQQARTDQNRGGEE